MRYTAAVFLFFFSGCATTAPQWANFGLDMLGCTSPGLSAMVHTAAEDLHLRALGAEGGNWERLGAGLAATYGIPLAICAVEAAVSRFGTPGHRDLAPPYVVDALGWLRDHKNEWTKTSPVPANEGAPAP